MRVSARNQRQVDTGYVDEQGYRDTEEPYPKPPIAVRTSPVGTMNMRFMMVTVLDLIHSFSCLLWFAFLVQLLPSEPYPCNESMSLNRIIPLFKFAHS